MSWEANRLEQQRLDKIARLQEAGMEAFPVKSKRTHTTEAALAAYAAADEGDEIVVTVAGRLATMRDMGKTVFAHIEDGFGRIQLFARRKDVGIGQSWLFFQSRFRAWPICPTPALVQECVQLLGECL